MIGGVKKNSLTPENVLKKISPFDIFKFFYRGKLELNTAIHSCFHYDEHPSMMISNRYGDLFYMDYAKGIKGDCFNFVQELYGVSLDESLKIIDRAFGLGFTSETNTGDYKRIVKEYKQPEEAGKRYSVIQVVTRKFTKEELDYWASYYIDISELKANNVYSVEKFFLNRKLFPLKENELRFGYYYPEGGFWKLYRPLSPKKSKWISNVPLNYSWGIENLSKENNCLIAKSLKDYLVCRKVFPYVVGIQNESVAAIHTEFVKDVKENSKQVFYGGDSDKAGKEASYNITQLFGFKHINPPDRLLEFGVKDFSDWAKYENLEEVKNHFIIKEVII